MLPYTLINVTLANKNIWKQTHQRRIFRLFQLMQSSPERHPEAQYPHYPHNNLWLKTDWLLPWNWIILEQKKRDPTQPVDPKLDSTSLPHFETHNLLNTFPPKEDTYLIFKYYPISLTPDAYGHYKEPDPICTHHILQPKLFSTKPFFPPQIFTTT